MAYKEMKLEKGEAQSLHDLWNAGMTPPKKKTAAKKTATKKNTATKKKTK